MAATSTQRMDYEPTGCCPFELILGPSRNPKKLERRQVESGRRWAQGVPHQPGDDSGPETPEKLEDKERDGCVRRTQSDGGTGAPAPREHRRLQDLENQASGGQKPHSCALASPRSRRKPAEAICRLRSRKDWRAGCVARGMRPNRSPDRRCMERIFFAEE